MVERTPVERGEGYGGHSIQRHRQGDDERETEVYGEQRCQDRADHRGAAVDSPRPGHPIRRTVRNLPQTKRKRHAHAERQRGNQDDGDRHLGGLGQRKEPVEQNRQNEEIGASDGDDPRDRNADGVDRCMVDDA